YAMDIDWVKVYTYDCKTPSSTGTPNNLFLQTPIYPIPECPDGHTLAPNIIKYKNIYVNPFATSSIITTTQHNRVTILEAEGTEIKPNFIADESTVSMMT